MIIIIMNAFFVLIFNLYRISNYWFNVAQVVFLIWNAINDPLFGYFQVSGQSAKEVVQTHQRAKLSIKCLRADLHGTTLSHATMAYDRPTT